MRGAGENERARELHEENLVRARRLGNRRVEAILLGALAMIAVDEGRYDDALRSLNENTPITREIGDPMVTGANFGRIAYALAFVGQAEPAARLLAACEAQFAEIGAKVPWVEMMNEETRERLRSLLDERELADALEAGRSLTVEDAFALALDATAVARD